MNNTSKVLAGIVVLLTVLTACASRDGSRFSASQALDDAVNAAQQADQLGYLWLSTDELIAQAEQALAEGEDERAIELAVQASTTYTGIPINGRSSSGPINRRSKTLT